MISRLAQPYSVSAHGLESLALILPLMGDKYNGSSFALICLYYLTELAAIKTPSERYVIGVMLPSVLTPKAARHHGHFTNQPFVGHICLDDSDGKISKVTDAPHLIKH